MQDAQTIHQPAIETTEPHRDSLFGVCQAVGDDLGFNPFFLRVALLALLFFSPLATIGAYVVLAGFVAASRFLFPDVRESLAEPGDIRPARTPVEGCPQPELIAA